MAATKWTNEQLQAIETRHCNLLVAAAAGSGKTAVLVERIIRMITDENAPVDIDRLLIVTFTSAAASEMRERIAAAISKALENNPSSVSLQRQLSLLNRANITTIHSFCLDVIKNNFHLIDIEPSFRIADETESVLLKEEILDELFEEKYEEDDEEFRYIVDCFSRGKDDTKLKELVLSLYRFVISGVDPVAWLEDACEEVRVNSIDDLENKKWAKFLKKSITLDIISCVERLRKAKDICEYTQGLEPYIDTFVEDIAMFEPLISDSGITLRNLYNELRNIKFGKLKTVRKDKVDDVESQNRVKKLRDDVKKEIKALNDNILSSSLEEEMEALNVAYRSIKGLKDLEIDFIDRFNKKKRERAILDFSDLEHLCVKILKENKSVRENFKETFEEVLVDEYQDTNAIQEELIGLVSRRDDDNKNVFMVGDVKQSIYKFRQAKPELFLEKYSRYPEKEGSCERKIMLYKNFRSRQEVIDGVNYIFSELMSEAVGELDYTEKEQLNLGASYPEIDEKCAAGDLELHILDKNGEGSDEESDIDEEKDNEEDEDLDAVSLEARIIAKRIRELIDGGYKVFDNSLGEYREIRYKDIVILLRAVRGWSETIMEELNDYGIPAYSDSGTGYFDSLEIRTIMSLLKVIDNPMQDIPLLAVINSPIFSFSAEELVDLKLLNNENDKYFYEIIKDIYTGEIEDINKQLKEKCIFFIEELNKWRDRAIYMPIDEFIWYLYIDTAYYGYVGAMPNGMQRQANLRILFQRAKQFESTSFKGLFNFINFVNKLKRSSVDMGGAKILGENEDVVRIMSIHKSKGLEFPVVFLSATGKQFNMMDLNEEILYHEELGFGPQCINLERKISYSTLPKYSIKRKFKNETLSEEMRVLYVALTRAKEKLIITGSVSNLENKRKMWANSAELSTGCVLPAMVSKGKSYLDWIGMALAKHRDGACIYGDSQVFTGKKKSLSKWNIKLYTREKISVDNYGESVDNSNREVLITEKNNRINREIERRLSYTYPHKDIVNIPSNISVSELKRKKNKEKINLRTEEDIIISKPKFLTENSKKKTAAEIGTIVHLVFEKINLDKVYFVTTIQEEIERLVEEEFITEEDAKVVDPYMIFKFYHSNIGLRLLKAYKEGKEVKRELSFFTNINVSEYDNEIENTTEDDVLRLQGIIDLVFEEEDGLVLVDYKTDYFRNGMEQEIKERYTVQLDLYKNTLEKIYNKKVKQSYIYLYKVEKAIEV